MRVMTTEIVKDIMLEEKAYILLHVKDCESENELLEFHTTIGRYLRNKYNFWDYKWEPVIVGGVDYSIYHPDNISFEIIREVWREYQVEKSNIRFNNQVNSMIDSIIEDRANDL